MPWSVAPLRTGRGWVLAPDPGSLRGRWSALLRAGDEEQRAALFRPSRARTPHTAVAPLPGVPAPRTARLRDETGGCPEPVPVLHGPYDQQWLLPDNRLLDAARPELWRVRDEHQICLVEAAADPRLPGAALAFTALLPDGWSPAGRPGRIRPLYRRRGGLEPNIAPGLLPHLASVLDRPVSAEDLLAWIAATSGEGHEVPFTSDPALWERGVELGRRALWLHTRGARCGTGERTGKPRMPGGRRPYVRSPLALGPGMEELSYDEEEQSLYVGESGRVAPVERAAWEYEAGGVRVVENWFAARAATGERGTLSALRPREWPQEWTSELLELLTILTLLSELEEERAAVREGLRGTELPASTLREAGILPPPRWSRSPASVLDLQEEGPDGQLPLL
ncbi:type ISP restriction/modification enzyme [Streptomyces sp. ODS28]|uniref:type ISP restriction/modification enzyme n=1 Tax=Streptomyces sp. ODS28 TaxID=3136688 RepID=UPI0031E689AA